MLEKIKNICKKILEIIAGIMGVGLLLMVVVAIVMVGFGALCLVNIDHIGVLMLIVMSVMTVLLLRASYHDSQ